MTWMATLPLLLLAVGVLFAPGYLIGRLLGLTHVASLAVAPAFMVTIIAVSAIVVQQLDLAWDWRAVLVGVLVIGLICGAVRIARRSKASMARRSLSWRRILTFTIALGTPAVIISYRFARIIGSPEHISQTFDNVFHLNAVRHILDTSSGSSMTLGGFTSLVSTPSFYPAAWHDLVALIADVDAYSIPIAVSITNIAIAAFIWPVGCIFLTSVLLPGRNTALLIAGPASAALGAFPYLMIDFGVLYPNLLSIALAPVVLGLSIMVLGLHAPSRGHRIQLTVALLLALPGLALAHPSTVMALIAMLTPAVLTVVVRLFVLVHRRKANPAFYIGLAAASVAYGIVFYVLWKTVRPKESAATWLPIQSAGQAIGEVMTQAPMERPVAWTMAILIALGLMVEFKRRRFWMIGGYLVTAGLFVIVSGFAPDEFRLFWTGVWYNDSYRLAALLPIAAVPLAASGGYFVVQVVRERIQQLRSVGSAPRQGLRNLATGVVFALTVSGGTALTTQGSSVSAAAHSAASAYALTADSPLISTDEWEMLEVVDEYVPEDDYIITDPWNGSSLSYALADRKALKLHIFSKSGGQISRVYHDLDDLMSDPTVCAAVQALDSYYVLDFGGREIHGGDHTPPSFQNLENNPGLELIHREGDTRLYEITACE